MDGINKMKLLLEDTVYDIENGTIAAWVKMTPSLNERMTTLWRGFMAEKGYLTSAPTMGEFLELADLFLVERESEYYAILTDAMLDMKETMKESFEEYKIDMTPEELEAKADTEHFTKYIPPNPIKIPIEG